MQIIWLRDRWLPVILTRHGVNLTDLRALTRRYWTRRGDHYTDPHGRWILRETTPGVWVLRTVGMNYHPAKGWTYTQHQTIRGLRRRAAMREARAVAGYNESCWASQGWDLDWMLTTDWHGEWQALGPLS